MTPFTEHALRHPFDATRMVYRRRWRDRRFGRRVRDGGVMGTLVRCHTCGGSGDLHRPDDMPAMQELWEHIPNATQSDIERWRAEAERCRAEEEAI